MVQFDYKNTLIILTRNFMKKNYQIEFDKIIQETEKSDVLPTLLLHSCCAPCSSHVLSLLTSIFSVTVFYYNPNIFPKDEYEHRKNEQLRYIAAVSFDNPVSVLDCDYESDLFSVFVKGLESEPEGGARCVKCFELRLEKTASEAAKSGFSFFSSTLTVSPHKNAGQINTIGESLQARYGVKWLFSDYKKRDGYRHSVELSRQYELYRQSYCGCIFSANELNHLHTTNREAVSNDR